MEKEKVGPVLEVELQTVPVMFVKAEKGPKGAFQAMQRLEKTIGSPKGRKFYGTYQNGEWRANVAIRDGDDPTSLGLERATIPGGKYAKRKITNYDEGRLGEILPEVFDRLAEEYKERVDPERPSIEFYRSQKELIVMLPIN